MTTSLTQRRLLPLLTVVLLATLWAAPVAAQTAVVRAVMFYSPQCPHCHDVMENVLPPLAEQYGDQLQLVLINVDMPEGQALYQAAIEHYDIPQERLGVPNLIIGDLSLVGSGEIPTYLPGLIEQGLAAGGLPWPAIPGLMDALPAELHDDAADPPAVVSETAPDSADNSVAVDIPDALATPSPSVWQRLANDPVGNTLAVIVLVGMVVVTAVTVMRADDDTGRTLSPQWGWLVPALAAVGLLVAAYLAWVEVTHTSAVCGPVGDCNTVQQSPYAYLFGILPIGVLGIVGYLAILLVWIAGRFGAPALASRVPTVLFVLTTVALMFSIYLTFLEPFVIGATCAWCLASAIIATALFWVSGEAVSGRLQLA